MTFRTLVVRTCLTLVAAAALAGSAVAGVSSTSRAPGGPDLGARSVRGQSYDRVDLDLGRLDDGPVAGRYAPQPAAVAAAGDASKAGDARSKGATFLKTIQHSDGGWGAGNWGQADDAAPSDVATTAMVLLALHRDANGTDVHQAEIARGVRYVLKSIASAPKDSPRVTTPEGTQPQRKLGQLVDTHLAAMMLSEVAGTLDDETNIAMDKGFGQVIAKVQLAQRDDGSFDGDGWAPVLSNSIAATSLMRAEDKGLAVDARVLDKSERYQAAQVGSGGEVDTSTGAGVDLYAVAGSLRTNSMAGKRAASPNKEEAERATAATVSRVSRDADALMTGFGSIGGEEMLGYMMISDSLADGGGERWQDWEGKVGAYLVGIQNADGSWVGHHCITSRTFTTAAAVMALGSGDWAARQAAHNAAKAPSKG
jgi:hypothetical protein